MGRVLLGLDRVLKRADWLERSVMAGMGWVSLEGDDASFGGVGVMGGVYWTVSWLIPWEMTHM